MHSYFAIRLFTTTIATKNLTLWLVTYAIGLNPMRFLLIDHAK